MQDGKYNFKFSLENKTTVRIDFYKHVFYAETNGAGSEYASDTVYKANFWDIQLESGANATEYEGYKQVQEVTANADGSVTGILSIAPNITLISNDDVIIECEYNKDINCITDQVYNAGSQNAQSGVAVAEALSAFYPYLTINKTAIKSAGTESLRITDATNLYSYPLTVKVQQTKFKTEVGVNKYSGITEITGEDLQEGWLSASVVNYSDFENKTITISFECEGGEPSTMSVLKTGDYGPEILTEYTLQKGEGGRYYADVYIPQDVEIWKCVIDCDYNIITINYTAIRLDGSYEYEPYEKKVIPIDLSKITVTEEISGQSAAVGSDGTVSGFYSKGANMKFTMGEYYPYCEISVVYKRDIKTIIEGL